MSLRVDITARAHGQLNKMANWWAEHRSAEQADLWYSGFARAIHGLATSHTACPLARENDCFPFEVRELLYGLGNKPTHRALFVVRSDSVLILVVRHAAQQDLMPDDL